MRLLNVGADSRLAAATYRMVASERLTRARTLTSLVKLDQASYSIQLDVFPFPSRTLSLGPRVRTLVF